MSKKRTGSDSKLVYSSEQGRTCPNCGNPAAKCACRGARFIPSGDGIARVRREISGRGGKTVTTISGIQLKTDELKDLTKELKQLCGSGGALKDGIIEIQGDHRDKIVAALQDRGFTVKLAGG